MRPVRLVTSLVILQFSLRFQARIKVFFVCLRRSLQSNPELRPLCLVDATASNRMQWRDADWFALRRTILIVEAG
jgi:hypothetical protein